MENYLRTAHIFLNKYISFPNKGLDWWINFRSPQAIFKNHASYLCCEIVFYIIGLLTFIHAMRIGGRYKWLWLATILHGITVECVSYFLPDIDNFWHAQSMVMLLGQRLPLHILFVYPAFIYTACVAVSHMNLRWWAEPFAVGLSVVLLDIPFDLMGVKLLWWTWHDDDPNIFDRHYWVPWTSYYFHAAFSSSFTLAFHGLRTLCCSGLPKFKSAGFFKELACVVLTGIISMPLGVLQFIPVYHPLHDSLGIHSEICVLMLVTTYILIIWSADRTPFETARSYNSFTKIESSLEIVIVILLHYSFYLYLVIFIKPENQSSTGFHQTIGPCGQEVTVKTPFGHVLKKSKYLCTEAFYEDYFDFSCTKSPPASGKEWYTICGTPYPNHMEYIIILASFCTVGLFWYWQTLIRSGLLQKIHSPSSRKHLKKE